MPAGYPDNLFPLQKKYCDLFRKQGLPFKDYSGPAVNHKLPDILVICAIRCI